MIIRLALALHHCICSGYSIPIGDGDAAFTIVKTYLEAAVPKLFPEVSDYEIVNPRCQVVSGALYLFDVKASSGFTARVDVWVRYSSTSDTMCIEDIAAINPVSPSNDAWVWHNAAEPHKDLNKAIALASITQACKAMAVRSKGTATHFILQDANQTAHSIIVSGNTLVSHNTVAAEQLPP